MQKRKYLRLVSLMIPVLFSLNARAVENPLFNYTHILPSPFTIPSGKFQLGTTLGIGVTDFFDVRTNLVADIYQIYNLRASLSLLDFPGFAAGLYLGYQNVNLNNISTLNPSLTVSSWMPGVVFGTEILPFVAWFFGGNLFYSNVNVPDSATLQSSGFVQGAQVGSDISWAYNPHERSIGNAISAGLSYNATYNFYGVGVSHHWKGFHLGVHYFPNASKEKVLPIVSGGAIIDI